MSSSDAREALRRYLEQRRELGESELRLDGLDVDDVMRLVGALGHGTQTAPPTASPPPPVAPTGGSDRAAPQRTSPTPEPRARERSRTDDVPATADWRAALRASGAAPSTPGASPARQSGPSETPSRTTEPEQALSESAHRSDAPEGTEEAMAKPSSKQSADRPAQPDEPTVAEPTARGRKMDFDAAGGSPGKAPALADIPAGIVIEGRGSDEFLRGTLSKLRTLDQIARMTHDCTRCPLHATATHAVPGEGNPDADFVCVGEAPGEKEDQSGKPFVGQSGQLLTKILAAIKLSREDVFICNVIKHRPPANRNPRPEEVEACSPYLLRQLELVKPKVIVAFGTFAAQTLLDTKLALGKLRGSIHQYHGIPLVVTYHPAALLRNPAWKRQTWEDVQLARRLLDRPGGT